MQKSENAVGIEFAESSELSLSEWEQQTVKSDSGESDSKEKLKDLTKRNLVGKKRKRKPEETESDSDYDNMNPIPWKNQNGKKSPSARSETSERHTVNKRRKTYLEEYLTYGELSGLIP